MDMQSVRLLKTLKHKHASLNGEPVIKKFKRLLALKTPEISLKQMPFSDNWANWFYEEARKLRQRPELKVVSIEHVGSTSISDMSSKNIIDIACRIELQPGESQVHTLLETLGYENYGPSPMGPDCLWYWRVEPQKCYALHVAGSNDRCFEQAILFRDYLNSHSDVQKKYQWFKLDAAEKYPDLFSYSVRKMDIYCELLAQAEIWKANQGGT